MFVYANVLFYFSPLFKWLQAQCATRYHHSPPKLHPLRHTMYMKTVNMLPKKKRANFEKVIQFSDLLSLEQNVAFFYYTLEK